MGSSSTTAEDESAEDETAGDSSTDTGEPIPCAFEDHFESAELDASWETFGSLPIDQSDGLLRIVLAMVDGSSSGGVRRQGDDLSASAVTVVVDSTPNPSTSAELRVNFSGGGNGMRLTITGGDAILYAFTERGTQTLLYQEYDIGLHKWLRFVMQDASMRLEASATGDEWMTLWEGAPPFTLGSVTTSLSGLTYELVMNPGTVAFDSVSICPLP